MDGKGRIVEEKEGRMEQEEEGRWIEKEGRWLGKEGRLEQDTKGFVEEKEGSFKEEMEGRLEEEKGRFMHVEGRAAPETLVTEELSVEKKRRGRNQEMDGAEVYQEKTEEEGENVDDDDQEAGVEVRERPQENDVIKVSFFLSSFVLRWMDGGRQQFSAFQT